MAAEVESGSVLTEAAVGVAQEVAVLSMESALLAAAQPGLEQVAAAQVSAPAAAAGAAAPGAAASAAAVPSAAASW